MKYMLLIVAFFMAGCSLNEELAKAYIMTEETVAPEWVDMSKNSYRQNDDGTFEKWFTEDEQIEVRELKAKSMKVLSDRLKKEIK